MLILTYAINLPLNYVKENIDMKDDCYYLREVFVKALQMMYLVISEYINNSILTNLS